MTTLTQEQKQALDKTIGKERMKDMYDAGLLSIRLAWTYSKVYNILCNKCKLFILKNKQRNTEAFKDLTKYCTNCQQKIKELLQPLADKANQKVQQ